jgi:hypothetical protein
MASTNYNNFIKKYIKTPVVNNIINTNKYQDSVVNSKNLQIDEIEGIDTDRALEMDDIRYSPLTTTSTDDEFKDMCVICGELKCTCYEKSMDEINAEDEAMYVASLSPYQRADYENYKKMEEFLRVYCGR